MTIALNEPKYAIEPSDFRCAACAMEVVVEDSFFSAVYFEAEAFRRRSYCLPCWQKPVGGLEGVFAFWRSRRPAPQSSPRRMHFDADLILEFFRRLSLAAAPRVESSPGGGEAIGLGDGGPASAEIPPAAVGGGDPGQGAASSAAAPEGAESSGEKTRLRLVLALLLIRKKLLIYESSATRAGREWLKLSEKADPTKVYLVENPPLSDLQLDAVKISLGELLQMDLG